MMPRSVQRLTKHRLVWSRLWRSLERSFQSLMYWNAMTLKCLRVYVFSVVKISVNTCGSGLRPDGVALNQYLVSPTWNAKYFRFYL